MHEVPQSVIKAILIYYNIAIKQLIDVLIVNSQTVHSVLNRLRETFNTR